MKTFAIRALFGVAALVILTVGVVYVIGLGTFGSLVHAGSPSEDKRPPDVQAERAATQEQQSRRLGVRSVNTGDRAQIVFGDLHVHSGFSADAFMTGMPGQIGEGTSTVSDACDFARFCSALDFFSINDHAEVLTERKWRETVDTIRQCSEVANDDADPDLVAFLGWEWTQMGTNPGNHWGHRNIVLRGLGDDEIPSRPIAAGSPAGYMNLPTNPLTLGLMPLMAGAEYHDLVTFYREAGTTDRCAEGVPVRDLPSECREYADNPSELFAKLDDWGHDAIVIPHGTTWGMYTPLGSSFDKQIPAIQRNPAQQRLVEVYSGHGNSEEYRDWKEIAYDSNGDAYCPEPTPNYLPSCQRAGQLIHGRCASAGESEDECERRAELARLYYVQAETAAGHLAVHGARPEDWLDSGQCTDCFLPSFNYRPKNSVQYMLGLRDFENGDSHGGLDRFHFGFIASSDGHSARAGTGYKEVDRIRMTDSVMQFATSSFGSRPTEQPAEPVKVDLAQAPAPLWLETERAGSFFSTGGLAAVHTASRSREDIYDALEQRATYGTSGPRILLWFDLLNGTNDGGALPMGSKVTLSEAPRFEVRAMGSFEQKPGCPEHVHDALGAERVQRLCANECYHPSDVRRPITRIEVVRIRPQKTVGEDIGALVEDPWRVLPCDGDPWGCSVRFYDPEFDSNARDTLYYVRAIETASPTINADTVRCERDENGSCTAVDLCRGDRESDCTAPAEHRAWSSPIYVDYTEPPIWKTSDAPTEAF